MERVMDVDNAKEIVNDDPMELINGVDLDIDEIFYIQMAEMQMINHTCQQLEMRQHIGAIILLCNVVHALHWLEVLSTCIHSRDCIGAIDGTHIRVKVPRAEAPRFRGRKEFPTQNVFAACDFDMKFTYVLAGWEGTTSDSRILKDALSREDPLKILEGKFYIGDVGFMLKRMLLTPYRGVRYHLKEYSARGPQNSRELFNHRHSSLRNVIERTFGVLKKRFPIISSDSEPHYSFETMRDIVLACCILHNFLRAVDDNISLIAEVDHELLQQDINGSQTQQRDEDYREGELLRDNIANEMWNAYQV
ncbi:PREDICTED: putative nuclease HARBI1 [Lupinus angustifolius]|uniref:putative nuclease HARBI1 n=1 Tax=Lupinus angustifolius TaxID=3871 RepID=UPI00092FB596|nr:PREDICTED: putative nuclease HARBI1 [Lupinus angustifolius]